MAARRYLDQRLKLQMLRAADAVALHGSVVKAAAALGISQPGLTKCLQELEDIVQVRLFDRHSRGVHITDAGTTLVETGRKILSEVRKLEEQLDLLGTPENGSVTVGALPVAAAGILPGVLARLRSKHPHLQIKLQQGRTDELLPLLACGELDLIVGRLYHPRVPDGLNREALWMEPISLLARHDHPIFQSSKPSARDIARYDLVLPMVSQRVGEEIDHLLSLLDVAPTPSLRSNSYEFIREMLHSTDVISVMPKLMMVGDLLRGTLNVIPLPVQTPERPAGIIQAKRRELPAGGLAFTAGLRTYVEEISAHGLVATSKVSLHTLG